MNWFLKLFLTWLPLYMAEGGGGATTVLNNGDGEDVGDGGGNGSDDVGKGGDFDAQAARTFLSDFVDVPNDAKEEDLKKLQERISRALEKHGKGKGGDQPWSDRWREAIANGDQKVLKRLQRFKDPSALFTSYHELESTLSGGGYIKPLGKDATEEEIRTYRAKLGIPDKFEAYLDTQEFQDLKLAEEDKPIVHDFLENVAHRVHMPPALARQAVQWLKDMSEARVEEIRRLDEEAARKADDLLRDEWGRDYRGNMNAIHNLLSRAPQEVQDARLADARLPDGTALFNHPGVLKWLSALENEINPASRVLPSGGGSDLKTVEGRIAEIEEVMRADRAKYNRDERMQAELRELYAAREKLKARAA